MHKPSSLSTSDFDYHLPPEYIAQTPLEPRDSSRLMVLDRHSGQITHAYFHQLGHYLDPGDLLVLNETRVIPARLFAHKLDSGGRVELLLLNQRDPLTWEALVGGKGLRLGRKLILEPLRIGDTSLQVEIVELLEGARRLIHFASPVEPLLSQLGHVPLPPYVHTPLSDPERYQTVYANQSGSAAAPTAGLHFTPRLMQSLQQQGVQFARLTLHVGLDTFAPVTEEDPLEHKIHTEWCQVDAATAQVVNQTRLNRRRVIAVGTTSVRSLESAAIAAAPGQAIAPYSGSTGLFIFPGYTFRAVDAMITNFHLPRSTLIMLVSAFAGRERILDAYETAKREGYRFYSFGDAMLIL